MPKPPVSSVALRSITPDSDPQLIWDAHLFLLDQFGTSIGYSYFPYSNLEPPSAEQITVFGRFDQRAREREFGLQIETDQTEDGQFNRVAWLTDLYLPKNRRRQGNGTRLIEALLQLWERAGVVTVRATATSEGYPAFISWGFSVEQQDGPLSRMALRLKAGQREN